MPEVKENFFTDKVDFNEHFAPESGLSIKTKQIDLEKEIIDFPLAPYGQRLFVIEDELESIGQIFVPQTARQGNEGQLNTGYVVAVGPEVQFVKVRDRVFYGQHSGAYMMEKKFRMMNERDIIARFKEKDGD